MKTTLKVLSIIAKIVTVIFAIIGVLMTGVTLVCTNTFVGHVNDVLDEDIDKDTLEVTSEACERSMTDANLMEHPFIRFASKIIGPVIELFWKF